MRWQEQQNVFILLGSTTNVWFHKLSRTKVLTHSYTIKEIKISPLLWYKNHYK